MKKTIISPENKIKLSAEDLKNELTKFRSSGYKICFTTGSFDLLHEGHLKYLLAAKKYGDVLVVGVDSDDVVRNKKGEDRPINKQESREFIIAGFECVDLVVRRDDIMVLLTMIRPDYLVRSRTTSHDIENRSDCVWVRRNCGQTIILDPMSDNHTSKIIEVVKRRK